MVFLLTELKAFEKSSVTKIWLSGRFENYIFDNDINIIIIIIIIIKLQ